MNADCALTTVGGQPYCLRPLYMRVLSEGTLLESNIFSLRPLALEVCTALGCDDPAATMYMCSARLCLCVCVCVCVCMYNVQAHHYCSSQHTTAIHVHTHRLISLNTHSAYSSCTSRCGRARSSMFLAAW